MFFAAAPPLALLQAFGAMAFWVSTVRAQSPTFGGNAQHTALFTAPVQHLVSTQWTAMMVVNPMTSYDTHFAAPLITASNSVVIQFYIQFYGLKVYDGPTGRLKYTLSSNWQQLQRPNTLAPYSAGLAAGPNGLRLYYPGAGGIMNYLDNPDSDTPGSPTRICFYESLADYDTNAGTLNNNIYITTPITADSNGVIFFGFYASGSAAAALNITNGGFARIAPDGSSTYVLAGAAAGDNLVSQGAINCAPALSNDGTTLYVSVIATSIGSSYLLGLDSTTLATKYKVFLLDPRNGNPVVINTSSTASPTVGPDGDIFLGVSANPDNHYRGFMLHFSADLATTKLPASFGWDYTEAIVPTSMVPWYTGPSSYLLFSKYNNYNYNAEADRIALLDPNVAQTDGHANDLGISVMREVLTAATPSGLEWCINSAAVNPPTSSVFAPNEDGRIYRWNLLSNCLDETFPLHLANGEPYVPTVIAPDGRVYTIFAGSLYALGNLTNLAVLVFSSSPDQRSVVIGQPLTITALVTNQAPGPTPTGTLSFYDGTTAMATRISLTNGRASVTATNLTAGAHFIKATYNGDANYPSVSGTMVQAVHTNTTTLSLGSSVSASDSNSVTFTATVASPDGGTPTGMVTFWDGSNYLAQIPLSSGLASFTTTNLGIGSHAVRADYSSDVSYAASSGSLLGVQAAAASAILADGSFQLAFTNLSGAPFSVLRTIDLSLAQVQWVVVGPAIEVSPGQFQFTDPQAATYNSSSFYRVRSP